MMRFILACINWWDVAFTAVSDATLGISHVVVEANNDFA